LKSCVSDFSICNRIAVRHPTVSSKLSWSRAIKNPDDLLVVGLTYVDGRLFVLVWPSQHEIQVYDTKNFTLPQEGVRIKRLGDYDGTGLTSCATNKCLYVSVYGDNKVYKVRLGRKNAVSSWPVADGPLGLSVNADCNLLVACRTSGKIQEYNTSSRSLVREVSLLNELQPWHAIQLTCGRFVVSCSNRDSSYQDVLELGIEGEVLVGYTREQLIALGQKCYGPCHLAVDRSNEYVFLADRHNNRVVTVKRSLNSGICKIDVSVDGVLEPPSCLYFDESSRQLFVGDTLGVLKSVFSRSKPPEPASVTNVYRQPINSRHA
jgi:DNA-binding beta-propeller fold protein YncE